MSGIIWLASYPKSGNTWFRIFVSNLLKEADEEIKINQLKTDGIFSSRHILDRYIGIESSNLTMEEIDRLRPKVYNHLAQSAKKELFVKVHDAYTYLEDGLPLLGTVNAKAIYIMRNPLDVAVSFANHWARDIASAVNNLGKDSFTFCDRKHRLEEQTRQILLSWSQHVESWMEAREIPVHAIRYEDMKLKPLEAFQGAVKFIGLDYTEEQIQEAIDLSDFDKVKEEELKDGFKERPYMTESFFRKGQVGDWKNHLTEEQVEKIILDHYDIMKKYGYLDDQDKPVY